MFALSKTSRVTLGVLGGAILLFAFMSPGNVFGAEEATGGTDLTKPILSLAAAIAIAGGLIIVICNGSGKFSLDYYFKSKKNETN